MRTNHLWMMLAAFAIAGCSQNEITDMNPDANAPIGFGVYTGVQTKGLVTDNSTTNGTTANGLKATGSNGFGIQAYLTQANYATSLNPKMVFMDNQQVKYSSAWTYTPVKYWPNNATDKISFFAYAPYATAAGSNGITLAHATTTADPTLTFALQTAQKSMVDLVVSEAKTGTNGTINQQQSTSTTAVTMNFKHVLSRVAIKAKPSKNLTGTTGLTKVYITGISIEHSNKLPSKATLNMYSHTWATPATGNYLAASYALNNYASNGILNLSSQTFGNYTNAAAIDITTDFTNGVSLFPASQYLFFIPVNNATGTANDGDVSVKITYDIVTKASATSNETSKSTDTKTAKLPKEAFKKGSAYLYTFTITLNEIKVDVVSNMESWTDTSIPVTVP